MGTNVVIRFAIFAFTAESVSSPVSNVLEVFVSFFSVNPCLLYYGFLNSLSNNVYPFPLGNPDHLYEFRFLLNYILCRYRRTPFIIKSFHSINQCCLKIMPFGDRKDRNKSKLSDRLRGKSTDEILEEIKREFGNNARGSMFFDESDSRTSPQRVCTSWTHFIKKTSNPVLWLEFFNLCIRRVKNTEISFIRLFLLSFFNWCL